MMIGYDATRARCGGYNSAAKIGFMKKGFGILQWRFCLFRPNLAYLFLVDYEH